MPDPTLLDLPPSIETPRLSQCPPRTGDGAARHEALAESWPELRRFLASLPWVAADRTIESAAAFCRNGESKVIARRDLPVLAFEKATGRLVASSGLHAAMTEASRRLLAALEAQRG